MKIEKDMIPSQELRIGNVIDYSGNKHVITGVYSGFVDLHCIFEETNNPSFPLRSKNIELSKVNPIVLSVEILLEIGFEIHKDVSTTYILSLDTYFMSPPIKLYAYIDTNRKVTSLRMLQGQNRHGNMLEITNLHQLQNLIFILTGEELKYASEIDTKE